MAGVKDQNRMKNLKLIETGCSLSMPYRSSNSRAIGYRFMESQEKINPDAHSYALKHKAERYFRTYIANGVFIAAALHCGFRFKLSGRDNPNCRFNMSSKNIKRFDKR
jgi:hypothetical protein